MKYKMRVVRGAFHNENLLDELGAKVIENLEGSEWKSVDVLVADINQIKKLQKDMTKHCGDKTTPWYMDGYGEDNKDEIIVAFGADDGVGGKFFQFQRNDKNTIKDVAAYGVSKGIPEEQMDFMEIDF